MLTAPQGFCAGARAFPGELSASTGTLATVNECALLIAAAPTAALDDDNSMGFCSFGVACDASRRPSLMVTSASPRRNRNTLVNTVYST